MMVTMTFNLGSLGRSPFLVENHDGVSAGSLSDAQNAILIRPMSRRYAMHYSSDAIGGVRVWPSRHQRLWSIVLPMVVASAIFQAELSADEDKKAAGEFVEPILIEETLPNQPNELSLRLTTDYRHGDDGAVGALPNLQLFYGIIDRVGISLSIPVSFAKPDATAHYGLGDVSGSVKFLVIRPDSPIPALVFGVEAAAPTGNQRLGLGDGAYGLTPSVALLKDFGLFCVQGGVGWSKQVGEKHADAWNYGWAVSIPMVKDKLTFLTEVQGDWGNPNHATIAPGIKYNFTDNITLGVAIPVGLNRATERWGAVTQFQMDL